MKLRDRELGLGKTGASGLAPAAIENGAAAPVMDQATDKLDVHHPVA